MTAVERMPLVGDGDRIDTADEPWSDGDAPWYEAAAEFACDVLGEGKGRECLVIGSPVEETNRLWRKGWDATFLDIREPPEGVIGARCAVGDATNIPFPDNRFDAVSSTCVMCHAGLGRYGDRVIANGDVLMMREIARVLKPGGNAAIMAGPAFPWLKKSVVYGNVHRIYQPCDVSAMAVAAGLEYLEMAMFVQDGWMTSGTCGPQIRMANGIPQVEYCYLCVLLRKPG